MDLSLLRPSDVIVGPSGSEYVVLEVGERKAKLRTEYPTMMNGVSTAEELTVDQVALDGFRWRVVG